MTNFCVVRNVIDAIEIIAAENPLEWSCKDKLSPINDITKQKLNLRDGIRQIMKKSYRVIQQTNNCLGKAF